MRVVVYSDLHNGFSEFSPPAVDVDLVILAGDIHANTKGVDWAAKHFPDTRGSTSRASTNTTKPPTPGIWAR